MPQKKTILATILVALFGLTMGVEVFSFPSGGVCWDAVQDPGLDLEQHGEKSCPDPCHAGECHFGHCSFVVFGTSLHLLLQVQEFKKVVPASPAFDGPTLEGLRRPPRLA